MQSNIKVFLPLHTSGADVFEIISKSLDVEHWKRAFNKKVNVNLPCAMGNVWDVAFNHSPYSMQQFVDAHHDILKVVDMMDQKYNLYFYHSGVIDGYTVGDEKVVVLPANALMGAIGKKLVDFYSGKMVISNLPNIKSDEDGVSSLYESSTFIHSPPIKGKSVKKYRYQFTNHLAEINAVTQQDLVDMRQKNLWQATDHLLFCNMNAQFAKSYFDMEDLTKELKEPSSTNNSSVKKVKL